MRLYWGDATCDAVLISLSSVFLFPLSFCLFSFLPHSAELLNCPFSKAPQPQNLSRGNPQGHRRIRDGEREKARDERSASLNRLEENITLSISPSLILTPNVGAINWEDVEHILPAGIAGLGKRVGISIQTVVCPDSTWWKWMQF